MIWGRRWYRSQVSAWVSVLRHAIVSWCWTISSATTDYCENLDCLGAGVFAHGVVLLWVLEQGYRPVDRRRWRSKAARWSGSCTCGMSVCQCCGYLFIPGKGTLVCAVCVCCFWGAWNVKVWRCTESSAKKGCWPYYVAFGNRSWWS